MVKELDFLNYSKDFKIQDDSKNLSSLRVVNVTTLYYL